MSLNKIKGDNNMISEKVKEKLAEAVELWADDNLNGKPAILANMIYFAIEKEMNRMEADILEKF